MQLGELYAVKKDQLAELYLKNALNLRPLSREALYMLGMFYQETGRYDKAIATFKEALAMIPAVDVKSRYQINVSLAEAYEGAGKVKEAIAALNDALQAADDQHSKEQMQNKIEELKTKWAPFMNQTK